MRGQPASLGHVSSVGRCWRFPFPLCTSTRETVQECVSGLPDLISAGGGNQIKTIRSTSSKRSSICKPTWWSCCSQCLRVRITDLEIMKTYRDFPGNVLNGTIGKQMVDTLVESTSNVEVQQCLLSFCSTFYPFHFHKIWPDISLHFYILLYILV